MQTFWLHCTAAMPLHMKICKENFLCINSRFFDQTSIFREWYCNTYTVLIFFSPQKIFVTVDGYVRVHAKFELDPGLNARSLGLHEGPELSLTKNFLQADIHKQSKKFKEF